MLTHIWHFDQFQLAVHVLFLYGYAVKAHAQLAKIGRSAICEARDPFFVILVLMSVCVNKPRYQQVCRYISSQIEDFNHVKYGRWPIHTVKLKYSMGRVCDLNNSWCTTLNLLFTIFELVEKNLVRSVVCKKYTSTSSTWFLQEQQQRR